MKNRHVRNIGNSEKLNTYRDWDLKMNNGKIAIADIVYKPELAKITDFYKVAIAKHGLATKEFYSAEKWTDLQL